MASLRSNIPPSRVCGTRRRTFSALMRPAVPKAGFQLLEFALELERIQSDARGENVNCVRLELQMSCSRRVKRSIR